MSKFPITPKELSEWMRSQYVKLSNDLTTRFRDRSREAGEILRDASVGGVRIIYGPLGAGKSAFLRLFAKDLSELDPKSAAVYINYDEASFEIITRGLSPWGKYRFRRALKHTPESVMSAVN